MRLELWWLIFCACFAHDVRYKYNLSLFMYTCAIVYKLYKQLKTMFESVDISHIQICSTRMQLWQSARQDPTVDEDSAKQAKQNGRWHETSQWTWLNNSAQNLFFTGTVISWTPPQGTRIWDTNNLLESLRQKSWNNKTYRQGTSYLFWAKRGVLLEPSLPTPLACPCKKPTIYSCTHSFLMTVYHY